MIAYDGKTAQILKIPYLRCERRATDREEFQSSQFLDPYVRPRPRPDANAGVDVGDPIDHPAIAAMSLRELADLPLRTDPIATRAHRYRDGAQASKGLC